jgi:hypothetical protein
VRAVEGKTVTVEAVAAREVRPAGEEVVITVRDYGVPSTIPTSTEPVPDAAALALGSVLPTEDGAVDPAFVAAHRLRVQRRLERMAEAAAFGIATTVHQSMSGR